MTWERDVPKSAKPCTPVQFWSWPPTVSNIQDVIRKRLPPDWHRGGSGSFTFRAADVCEGGLHQIGCAAVRVSEQMAVHIERDRAAGITGGLCRSKHHHRCLIAVSSIVQ